MILLIRGQRHPALFLFIPSRSLFFFFLPEGLRIPFLLRRSFFSLAFFSSRHRLFFSFFLSLRAEACLGSRSPCDEARTFSKLHPFSFYPTAAFFLPGFLSERPLFLCQHTKPFPRLSLFLLSDGPKYFFFLGSILWKLDRREFFFLRPFAPVLNNEKHLPFLRRFSALCGDELIPFSRRSGAPLF